MSTGEEPITTVEEPITDPTLEVTDFSSPIGTVNNLTTEKRTTSCKYPQIV